MASEPHHPASKPEAPRSRTASTLALLAKGIGVLSLINRPCLTESGPLGSQLTRPASFTPRLITVVALIAVYGRREQPPGHGLRGA
jgi:hypothetical protein